MSARPRTSTSMHRCLRIADIQALICGSLTRNGCIQLAQTCTTLYEEAMNVVWADMHTLIPLIGCMSRDALALVTRARGAPRSREYFLHIDFCREPSPSDWRAFCKHAHRVRTFEDGRVRFFNSFPWKSFRGKTDTFSDASVFITSNALQSITQFIQQHCAADPSGLFPRLTSLKTHEFMNMFPAYLPYLSGDTLQTFLLVCRPDLSLEVDEVPHYTFSELVPIVRERWPHLSSVEFRAPEAFRPDQADSHVKNLGLWLKSLSNLQTFRVSSLYDASLVQLLSELPLLRTLNLEGQLRCPPDWRTLELLTTPKSFNRFRSLREMTLTAYQDDPLVSFIHVLSAVNTLTVLHLEIRTEPNRPPSLTEAPAIFEAVSHILAIDCLRISFAPPDLQSLPAVSHMIPPLDRTLLSQLFRLRHLRDLDLEGLAQICFHKDTGLDVAEAWPKLERIILRLDRIFSSYIVPQISLIGVQSLYDNCPNIKTIDACIDGTYLINPPHDYPRGAKRTIPVETLSLRLHRVGTVDTRSEEYFPMIIRLMFPQLKDLRLRLMGASRPLETLPPPPHWIMFGYSDTDEFWGSKVQERWKAYQNVELQEVEMCLAEALKGKSRVA